VFFVVLLLLLPAVALNRNVTREARSHISRPLLLLLLLRFFFFSSVFAFALRLHRICVVLRATTEPAARSQLHCICIRMA